MGLGQSGDRLSFFHAIQICPKQNRNPSLLSLPQYLQTGGRKMKEITILLTRYSDWISSFVYHIAGHGYTHASLGLGGGVYYSFNYRGFCEETLEKHRRRGGAESGLRAGGVGPGLSGYPGPDCRFPAAAGRIPLHPAGGALLPAADSLSVAQALLLLPVCGGGAAAIRRFPPGRAGTAVSAQPAGPGTDGQQPADPTPAQPGLNINLSQTILQPNRHVGSVQCILQTEKNHPNIQRRNTRWLNII